MSLFFWRRPSAVAWLVVPVSIGITVNAMQARRFSAHVSEEVLKFHPSLADSNSPTSVGVIILAFSVETAVFHDRPTGIFRPTSSNSIGTVAQRPSHDHFCSE